MDIVLLIAYISFFAPLLVLGTSFFSRTKYREIGLVQTILAVGFIIDLICLLLGKKGINTYPLGNLYFLFQASIIFIIYLHVLNAKKIIMSVALFYVVFFLGNYFFVQGPYTLNSYSHSLSSVLFILFSLLYLRKLLIELPADFAYQVPMVWINLAILVYYSGNLFLFMLNNYFTDGMEGNQRIVWALHNSLNIIKNVLFFISIWQTLRKTT